MRINFGTGQMPNNYGLSGSTLIKNLHSQNIAGTQKKDSVIEGIQEQISDIQKQMLSLSENDKLSVEDKMERQKELQKQLDSLNKMMLERNVEIKKQEQEEKSKAINEGLKNHLPKDENSDTACYDHMQNFISIDNSLNAVKTQSSIRTKLKGEVKILESEIKLDAAKGADTTKKAEKLSALSARIDKITSDISESLDKVDEEIKKGAASTNKAENKASEVKDAEDKENRPTANKTHKPIDVHI